MKKIIAVLMLLCVFAAPAMAASPWTEESTYSGKVVGKLNFGFKNALLGWTELFYEPHAAAVDGKSAWAGLGKGLVDFPLNTIGGAVHLVTFLIPVDVPLPHNGVNFEK